MLCLMCKQQYKLRLEAFQFPANQEQNPTLQAFKQWNCKELCCCNIATVAQCVCRCQTFAFRQLLPSLACWQWRMDLLMVPIM